MDQLSGQNANPALYVNKYRNANPYPDVDLGGLYAACSYRRWPSMGFQRLRLPHVSVLEAADDGGIALLGAEREVSAMIGTAGSESMTFCLFGARGNASEPYRAQPHRTAHSLVNNRAALQVRFRDHPVRAVCVRVLGGHRRRPRQLSRRAHPSGRRLHRPQCAARRVGRGARVCRLSDPADFHRCVAFARGERRVPIGPSSRLARATVPAPAVLESDCSKRAGKRPGGNPANQSKCRSTHRRKRVLCPK